LRRLTRIPLPKSQQMGYSMMHQTILAMLGLATCALILVAFWGTDLLGNQWRRPR
jgi:hypothetical protein